MTSEREAYVYIQLPGALETVPAALLRMRTRSDGTQIGRFRYGDRYLPRRDAVSLDPFHLPLAKQVFEFTQLKVGQRYRLHRLHHAARLLLL